MSPSAWWGDFNIAPEDRDLHDPQKLKGHVMASEQEREALRVVLGRDLKDVFRRFSPGGRPLELVGLPQWRLAAESWLASEITST